MTETATTHTPFRVRFPRTAASPAPVTDTTSPAGDADTASRRQRDTRLVLAAWLPRKILRRGASPTRDDERALHDLRAAQDRSDW